MVDEVCQTETRRTKPDSWSRSARGARSQTASRWSLQLSYRTPPLATPAAPDACGVEEDSALGSLPNTPGSTCATLAPRPRSPCRAGGYRVVLPGAAQPPGGSAA